MLIHIIIYRTCVNYMFYMYCIYKCNCNGFRYIFFADKVEIQDITKQTSFFVLVGPNSNQVRSFTIVMKQYTLFRMIELVYLTAMILTGDAEVEPWGSRWKTIWHTSTFQCKLD